MHGNYYFASPMTKEEVLESPSSILSEFECHVQLDENNWWNPLGVFFREGSSKRFEAGRLEDDPDPVSFEYVWLCAAKQVAVLCRFNAAPKIFVGPPSPSEDREKIDQLEDLESVRKYLAELLVDGMRATLYLHERDLLSDPALAFKKEVPDSRRDLATQHLGERLDEISRLGEVLGSEFFPFVDQYRTPYRHTAFAACDLVDPNDVQTILWLDIHT